MDGNGRWAAERGLSRASGHSAGLDNIRRIVRFFADRGVKYLTLFAFSTENWGRPDEEVKTLIELLRKAVRDETLPLHEEGVRINHLGRLDRLPDSLSEEIRESVELTRRNDSITLSVAYDYGEPLRDSGRRQGNSGGWTVGGGDRRRGCLPATCIRRGFRTPTW